MAEGAQSLDDDSHGRRLLPRRVTGRDVIHKDASTWTPAVHALLRHLADSQVPRATGGRSGFDDRGRQNGLRR